MTRQDGTGHNNMGKDMIGRDRTRHDRTRWDLKRRGTKVRDSTRQDGTGQDGTKRDGSVFNGLSFNSYVGFIIVLCMYIKLYYLLVTDLSKKCGSSGQLQTGRGEPLGLFLGDYLLFARMIKTDNTWIMVGNTWPPRSATDWKWGTT